MTRRVPAGFTLLEVMVAMAIVSLALVTALRAQSVNVDAARLAKRLTVATALARAKMVDLEEEASDKGLGDFEERECGAFDTEGFPDYRWCILREKIELPEGSDLQSVLGQATSKTAGGSAATSASATNGGAARNASLVASQFGLIKSVLEQSIRKVVLEVYWTGPGSSGPEQKLSVATYLTDTRQVERAMPGFALPGAGGTPGAATGAPPTGGGTVPAGTAPAPGPR